MGNNYGNVGISQYSVQKWGTAEIPLVPIYRLEVAPPLSAPNEVVFASLRPKSESSREGGVLVFNLSGQSRLHGFDEYPNTVLSQVPIKFWAKLRQASSSLSQ